MAEKTTLPPFVLFVSVSEVTRYSPNFIVNVGDLQHAKRGDWVRLMIRFAHQCEYCGKVPSCGKELTTDTEMLSAKLWAPLSTANLAKVRILSRPNYTARHSLDYQDDLTLSASYILDYVPLKPDRVQEEEYLLTGVAPSAAPIFVKDQRIQHQPDCKCDECTGRRAPRPLYDGALENQKLRAAAQSLPPLAPQVGRRYWLRNGAEVEVWTFRAATYYGKVVGKFDNGMELEWTEAGAHTLGNREYDIVKDPKVSEVIHA